MLHYVLAPWKLVIQLKHFAMKSLVGHSQTFVCCKERLL